MSNVTIIERAQNSIYREQEKRGRDYYSPEEYRPKVDAWLSSLGLSEEEKEYIHSQLDYIYR